MTQDSTMALGADFISDLFETPNTLAHKGVKGMKFVKDDINLEIEHSNLEGGDMSGASEELVAVDSMDEILAHYGILGMKWGVRKDDIPKGLGASGGGQIDEEDLLLAELMAKGLTADEIKKKIEDTLGKVNRTIEDIQYEIDKFEEHAVYPWEDVNQRVERQNNARNRRIEYDRRRDAEAKAEKDKQKAEDDAHGGRIYYDPMGFPTSPDDPFGRPAPRGAKHSSIEGGEMSNGHSEFTGLDTMDKILAHYGILGMKWGVRNDDRGSGRPQGGPSKKKAPLASVKKAITKSPASTEEIVNKFYAKHTPKSMEFTMKDSATGKESFPIKYDEKILKRMSDQQNHAVFQSQKGVPKEVAERELAYIKSQMKAASESLNVKTSETEKTSQGNRISDDELRAVINRLQLEKTYKQLMAERNPPAPKKAESAILKILRDSTRQAAGEILKGTVTAVGKYAMAAAISKSNPALANSILNKNEGNWATKKEEDTSQPKTKSPQNGSQTPKSNLGIKEADDHINKVATKITDDFMATMPKASSTSSSTSNEAGKRKIAEEMDSNPRTSSSLDLGPTPQQKVDTQRVEDAYARATGQPSEATTAILDALEKLRNK